MDVEAFDALAGEFTKKLGVAVVQKPFVMVGSSFNNFCGNICLFLVTPLEISGEALDLALTIIFLLCLKGKDSFLTR